MTSISPVRHESKRELHILPEFTLGCPMPVCAFQHCCQNNHMRWHRQSQARLLHPEGDVLPEKCYHFTTQTPMMTLCFRHLWGISKSHSNVSQGLIWSFNSRLWFSVTKDNTNTVADLDLSVWLTINRPAGVSWKLSGQDTERKCSWIAAFSNRKSRALLESLL